MKTLKQKNKNLVINWRQNEADQTFRDPNGDPDHLRSRGSLSDRRSCSPAGLSPSFTPNQTHPATVTQGYRTFTRQRDEWRGAGRGRPGDDPPQWSVPLLSFLLRSSPRTGQLILRPSSGGSRGLHPQLGSTCGPRQRPKPYFWINFSAAAGMESGGGKI